MAEKLINIYNSPEQVCRDNFMKDLSIISVYIMNIIHIIIIVN